MGGIEVATSGLGESCHVRAESVWEDPVFRQQSLFKSVESREA